MSRYWWAFQALLWSQAKPEVAPLDSTRPVGSARRWAFGLLLACAFAALAPMPAWVVYGAGGGRVFIR